jgi:sulfur-carrier protein adenylyltransferase/sulfurtransferase
MNKKYIIPIALLVGLAFILVLLPAKKTYNELPADELLRQITSPSRFISPDAVADRIIKKDPSILLVDVRPENQYKEFALPGALNIPLQNLLLYENVELLTQEGFDVILYSTGDILSDQAWILCKRKGLNNIYVMKGGLNQWFDSFFNIQPLPETASNAEIALWQYRTGVRQFFTGSEIQSDNKTEGDAINVTPKKKKSAAEGGC